MRYEVVIFGGGATGTATFRDLAMRGFEAALVERRPIASGTTSASHQNLLGGLRYVINDPIVAQECAEENAIISAIAPEVIGKLRNYFVGFGTEYSVARSAGSEAASRRSDRTRSAQRIRRNSVVEHRSRRCGGNQRQKHKCSTVLLAQLFFCRALRRQSIPRNRCARDH